MAENETHQDEIDVPRLPWEQPRGGKSSIHEGASKVLGIFQAGDEADNPEPDEAAVDDDVAADEEDELEANADEGEPTGETDESEPTGEEDDDLLGDEPLYELDTGDGVQEVTLSELADGYLRQADYTRKTQALAEQRKQTAEELAQMREAREEYRARLAAVEKVIQQQAPKERTAEEWNELRAKDPERYNREWTDAQRWKTDREAVTAEQERLNKEAQAEMEAELREQLAAEQEKMREVFEWESDEQANEHLAQLQTYGTTLGFTEEQLQGVYDHRLVVLLDKARRYDELVSKGSKLEEKIKDAPRKRLRAGGRIREKGTSRSKKAHRERVDRLRKSGRVDDAAQLVLGAIKEGAL